MKQSWTYLQRIYPQLLNKNHQSVAGGSPNDLKSRVEEDVKIQSKLKHILHSLEESIIQDKIIKSSEDRTIQRPGYKNNRMFHNRLRSISYKHLMDGKRLKEFTTIDRASLESNQRDRNASNQSRNASNQSRNASNQSRNASNQSRNASNQSRNSRAHTYNIDTESFSVMKTPKGVPAYRENQGESRMSRIREISMLPKIAAKNSYRRLESEQKLLGKKVLEKVENHFNTIESKKRDKYYERVKSEQNIDDSLVEYLRHKVKMADLAVKHHK